MGLILDTSFLIEKERRGESATDILRRARHDRHRARRRTFAAEIFKMLIVYPLTLEIAQLAGRIEGEQAAMGNVIAFEDLIIGATALHLGFEVATLNRRHFERIPGLRVAGL